MNNPRYGMEGQGDERVWSHQSSSNEVPGMGRT
jgi:hypothetical protein